MLIAVRKRFGRDNSGRGTAWIPEYDASKVLAEDRESVAV
jgi:hypothetical protein